MNTALLLAGGSGDVASSFMIKGLFTYSFFGHEVWITTSHVCILIVMLLIVGFAIAARIRISRAADVPTGFQNVIEMIVEKLDGMVEGSMDRYAPAFRNYIGTVFIFILISNLSGLIGLRPPTADYGTTLPLALITFTLIHVNTVTHNKASVIWADKCSPLPRWFPLWLPINIISDIAVPISLSLRLFANVLSGVVMEALVYGLMGLASLVWPSFLHAYLDIFSGAIQTYVFCMLTMTYIRNGIGDDTRHPAGPIPSVPSLATAS